MKGIILIFLFSCIYCCNSNGIVGSEYIKTYELSYSKTDIESSLRTILKENSQYRLPVKYNKLLLNYIEKDSINDVDNIIWIKIDYSKAYIVCLDKTYYVLLINNSTKPKYNTLTVYGIISFAENFKIERNLKKEIRNEVIMHFENEILPLVKKHLDKDE